MYSLGSIIAFTVSFLILAHPAVSTSVDNSIKTIHNPSLILSGIPLLNKRDDSKVLSCLRAIGTNIGADWKYEWNTVRSDGISKDECIYSRQPEPQYYNIQLIRDGGNYRARILQGDVILKVVEVPICPKKIQPSPSFGTVLWYLIKAFENDVQLYAC